MAVPTNRRPQRGPAKGPANNRNRDAKKDILSKTREVAMRDARPASAPTSSSVQLHVTGWRSSKAASNNDGGVSALTSFLERRAGISSKKHNKGKGITKQHAVRIRKTTVDGDTLIINISSDDVRSFLSINGYEFAGANLKITLADAQAGGRSSFSFNKSNNSGPDLGDASQVRQIFKGVLARRYSVDNKVLDLSSLGSDPDLNKIGVMEITPKTFQVLMKICDDVFTTAKAKEDGVVSVSLANNKLKDVSMVTYLASTFPALKNLDLHNNSISEMRDLQRWRHKFRQLEHIILTNNPIEQEVPDFKVQLIKWYPKLHSIDLLQIPAAELEAIRAKKGPPKVQPGRFDDQGGIGEQFLKTFFAGYDNDRNGLAQYYYDENSTFQVQVNTRALKDPSQPKPQGNEWTHYIKHSRNLLKLDHLNARARRSYRGPGDIAKVFAELPATRHPDFASSPEKWLLECRPQPGLPDPTGAAPGGVNGLVITAHGEFEEPQNNKLRSFDRTFVLGPGGPNGVRVISDSLTVRAYGGYEAYQPEPQDSAPMNEAQEKEMMALEVSKATGMNMQYSVMCLEQVGWSYQDALAAFASHKDAIPAEAYIQ
ncbi:uncharacterized protein PV09_01438 [Verruconis gallopava]|uniref:TAP-C domain-containing protein n=1 Tax=Verruconis gallopava TaxID=253628 RepID=A0A0D2ALY3_9PEZI|nr:uncharacterized protein PV09_01438 [Verruconis gallopava]KIW07470.1 hypothetical protein PV09_01438 [Verruconis gallopava]